MSVTDNEEITEQISKAAVNFFVEDWRDEAINDFSAALCGMVEEISEIGNRPESDMERISLLDGGTSDERLIDIDPVTRLNHVIAYETSLNEKVISVVGCIAVGIIFNIASVAVMNKKEL